MPRKDGFSVVRFVESVVFLGGAALDVVIFLFVVVGVIVLELVVVCFSVVEGFTGDEVIKEVVDFGVTRPSVETGVCDDDSTDFVVEGSLFPVDGCNGKYPIGS